MTRYSRKVGNLLFGRHKLNTPDGLCVQESLNRPNGRSLSWRGNEGVLFYLYDRIEALESEVEILKANRRKRK